MSTSDALINRISSAVKAGIEAFSATTRLGTQREGSKHTELLDKLKVEQDRISILKDSLEMYLNWDPAKAVVDNVGENATRGGFSVKVEGDAPESAKAKAEEEINQMLKRTKLAKRCAYFLKRGFIDGDLFAQVIVDSSNTIVEIERMPVHTMRRHSNDQDRFEDPTKAFYQVDPLSPTFFVGAPELTPTSVEAWFAQWQIIHGRWNHMGGRYGTPLFRSSRGSWKKAKEGETDMAIRRKTRAGMKYIHSLEGASETDIEKYKEMNKDVLQNKWAAIADFFSSSKTNISAIQGDAKLSEIDDVKHHINNFFAGMPIAKGLIGYGEDINRDVLDKQDLQYVRNLETASGWLSDEIILPMIELQLLLKGIVPDQFEITIDWPDRYQEMIFLKLFDSMDSVVKIKALGLLRDETIIRLIARIIPDIDVDAEIAALEEKESQNQSQQNDFDQMQAQFGKMVGQLPAKEPDGNGKKRSLNRDVLPVGSEERA